MADAEIGSQDINRCDVRFTPKSGHGAVSLRCPLCAISGHRGPFLGTGFGIAPDCDVAILSAGMKRRQETARATTAIREGKPTSTAQRRGTTVTLLLSEFVVAETDKQ